MNPSTAKPSALRLLEWVAGLIGASNSIYVPFLFVGAGAGDFPLPALYFIEIALVGVVVILFVAARPRFSPRWNAVPWTAAGIMLAFVILGGFSIGPFLIPALLTFVLVGLLADLQTGGPVGRHLGCLLVVGLIQGGIMLSLTLTN